MTSYGTNLVFRQKQSSVSPLRISGKMDISENNLDRSDSNFPALSVMPHVTQVQIKVNTLEKCKSNTNIFFTKTERLCQFEIMNVDT